MSAKFCKRCGMPDRDLCLEAMKRAVPGSTGYYAAMSSWAPDPCECSEPEWEREDDDAPSDETREPGREDA